jgi:serine/threonine protein kinase
MQMGTIPRHRHREARIAARISHPNLVSVYDYGSEDGSPFLVMEYIEGESDGSPVASTGGKIVGVRRSELESGR